MTKNKIIKGLIRGYGCDDEDDCILSCNDCIHQKFIDYEKQIRADVIDEFEDSIVIKIGLLKQSADDEWVEYALNEIKKFV